MQANLHLKKYIYIIGSEKKATIKSQLLTHRGKELKFGRHLDFKAKTPQEMVIMQEIAAISG